MRVVLDDETRAGYYRVRLEDDDGDLVVDADVAANHLSLGPDDLRMLGQVYVELAEWMEEPPGVDREHPWTRPE